jgi:DNA-directed RNA polymerase specialized sigma24 family protein
MENSGKPWWADDPELAAIRRRVEEELERAGREPITPDEPDPVVQDIWSGASLRELAAARDDLERARARYADAVRRARIVGFSWGEIGRVLGVSKQLLHRRFSRPARQAPGPPPESPSAQPLPESVTPPPG